MKNSLISLFKYAIIMLLIFFIGRLSLFLLYFNQFNNTGINYWLSFIYGSRLDLIIISIFMIIPILLLTLIPKYFKYTINIFLQYYFLIIFCFLIYIEVATFPFIAQYDVRPNYIFVEYLKYPKEVFSMIYIEYKIELIIAIILIISFILFFIKKLKYNFNNSFELNYFKRVILSIPLIIILFIGIRSSFGHRAANISDAMYSTNRMINEITKNSLYSILYAIYTNSKHEAKDIAKRYGYMSIKEALNRVEKSLNIKSDNKSLPLRRLEKSNFQTSNQKNLIIFIQESIGYQFVKSLGGEEGITPNIDKLSKESILFKNLFSSGTRSVRGIASLVAGNLAVPGRGVLKRNRSQKDYFTISKLLKPYGYHTSFIYAGESRFDNMKSWFSGNGFDQIIEQKDFKNPAFIGTWGVSDEDLVKRANEEYKKLYSKKQKFASVIFSTSNHSPFDFPENKIELIENVPIKSVKNAIKYADFAIGEFIKQAKKEAYYKDTIFVIVADHNVRVYGSNMVPINMFQIPGIILGYNIKPMVYDKLTTQPDVLATALDLMGIDLSYPIMGKSIFSNNKKEISLMQFNDYYALRKKDEIAIIRPNKEPLTFKYNNPKLIATKQNISLQKDALAFITLLNYMYQNKLYK